MGMTEAKLKQLKEMFGCLEHLQNIRKALDNDNKPHMDVTIAVHDYDMSYDEMTVKVYPDFEEEFRKFIDDCYLKMKRAFDAA